jgi:hypothetical protein
MLLKFTTADMLNTALIDVESSERAYTIATVLETGLEAECSQQTAELPSVCFSGSDNTSSSSPSHCKRRRTTIQDSAGNLVASLVWNGRHPDITIAGAHIGGLTDLFGSSTIRFM